MSIGHSFISPQLASFASKPPVTPGWLFERKYDGYRLQIHVGNGTVRAFSRNGHDVTAKIQTLIPAFSFLGQKSLVLDGELCASSKDGTTDIGVLAASFHHGGPFRFYAYDLLSLNGIPLHDRPLLERKALLADCLSPMPLQGDISFVPFQFSDGEALFAAMKASGHEGIIAKRVESHYRPGGRTSDWQKIKVLQRIVCTVIGWQPDRTNMFVKSLVLGFQKDDGLEYCGRVGTGFTAADRQQMHHRLQELERSGPSLHLPRKMSPGVRWCDPKIEVTVQTAELSNKGILKIPSYVG